MDGAIWGLIGTAVGALASIGTTWVSGWHAANLQKQAASLDRVERARSFQRQNLLDLQEALNDALRMVTRGHLEDVDSFKEKGHWGQSFLSEDVNEGVRATGRKASILIERVADDALRSDLKKVTAMSSQVLLAKSREEAEKNFAAMVNSSTEATEHMGRVLRSLY